MNLDSTLLLNISDNIIETVFTDQFSNLKNSALYSRVQNGITEHTQSNVNQINTGNSASQGVIQYKSGATAVLVNPKQVI